MYHALFNEARDQYIRAEDAKCQASCFDILTYAHLPRSVRCQTLLLLAMVADFQHADGYVEEAWHIIDEMTSIDHDEEVKRIRGLALEVSKKVSSIIPAYQDNR